MSEKTLILAIGDVHLGTACSGIPDGISDAGIDLRELTPATALRSAVDLAIEKQVIAVLFAGDVVESTNARFEALAPLEESVRRLLDAGIEVIAVAGNHDVEALPRLANLIDGFKLLGAEGRWGAITLSRGATPVAQIVGWSFAEKYVRQSPVAQLLSEPLPSQPAAVPRIGLLHCDLGASGGGYAPVRQAELDDTGYDAWLLGHIHKPSLAGQPDAARERPSGYLGSLAALDPSETGPRGPWLVEVSADGRIKTEHVPQAPVRWESVDVSVEGMDHVEDVRDRLLDEAQKHARVLEAGGSMPRALGLRVRLTGSTGAYEDVRKWIAGGEWRSRFRMVDGTAIFFNRIDDAMDLHLDLKELALGTDPAALLARRVLLLEQDGHEARLLIDKARARLAASAGEHFWSAVDHHRNAIDPLADDALRDVLIRAGKTALSAMLAGQEAGGD